jgi:hypothetical protein
LLSWTNKRTGIAFNPEDIFILRVAAFLGGHDRLENIYYNML